MHRQGRAYIIGVQLTRTKPLGHRYIIARQPAGNGIEADIRLKRRGHPPASRAYDVDILRRSRKAAAQRWFEHKKRWLYFTHKTHLLFIYSHAYQFFVEGDWYRRPPTYIGHGFYLAGLDRLFNRVYIIRREVVEVF